MAIKFILQNFEDVLSLHPAATVYVVNGKLYLNKKAEEITGFKSENFSSVDDWFRVAFPENVEKIKEFYLNSRKLNFPKVDRVEYKRADGQRRIIDFQGKVIGEIEVWHLNDVTEMISTEQRFFVLFNYSSDPHLLLDETGMIDCNEAMVKMLNAKDKEEILSVHPATFSPERQPDGQLSKIKKTEMDALALQKGQHKFDWVLKKITGEEFSVQVTINSVKLGSRRVFLSVIHDLTEEKETQAKMLTSAKMATLGEMASNIAHEINNPLAVINAYTHRIKKHLVGCNESSEILDMIASTDKIAATVNRISKIIKGLRSFAREADVMDVEVLDVKSVVMETLDICHERIKNGGVCVNVTIPENCYIKGQSVQISQVVMNLIGNSFDAVSDLSEKWISVTVASEPGWVKIRFADSGRGIESHVVNNMMRPFFTTKEVGKGTGLGLSISKGIIESHGGCLEYQAFNGHTSFLVTLPTVDQRAVSSVA